MLKKNYLQVAVVQKKIPVDNEKYADKDRLTDLYLQHIIPLPQRDLPNSRWGKRMEKKRASQSAANAQTLSSGADGSRKRPILFDGSSTSTSIKLKKIEAGATDRLKPPPSGNLANTIRRLSNTSTNCSSDGSLSSAANNSIKHLPEMVVKQDSATTSYQNPNGNVKSTPVSVTEASTGGTASMKLKRAAPKEGDPEVALYEERSEEHERYGGDPEHPHKLHLITRIKSARRRPYWEKKVVHDLGLDKERLEQERKEKKKQKEKERKERLKKEGKLLTKTQKEARARAEATLKLLQAQGVEVPSKDSVPKKKPIYVDKKKKKPQQQIQEEQVEVTSPTTEQISIETIAEVKQTEQGSCQAPILVHYAKCNSSPVKEQKPDADLDDWEAMASDEEKEKEKQKEIKKVHIEVTEKAGEHEEEEESDEEADDEEEDEEESEEEEEEEEKASDDTQKQQQPPAGKSPPNKRPSKDLSSESETESDSDDGRTKEERLYDKAKKRIEKRRAENIKNINTEKLRSPVICVLGHVDTGKTKILDKFDAENIKIPGMLIIDTPGHESFSNLRNRGSSLCDIAILVVDIMHGLEPQTLESINLLKEKKCPFIVALNKIDRLYDWKKSPETDLVTTLKKQKKNTKDEFDERAKAVILEFAQQGLNAALFHENKDPRTFVSLVPTSAHTGDGMGNLIALLVELTQTMLSKRLAHCDELRAQVMEVKALPGMGTTIDVILINGCLREGETIIVPGVEGPIITQIRGLLLPPPLKELRVKNQYEKHKEVCTAQGVKILGKDLEKTLAGLPLLVAHKEDEIPVLRDELIRELKQTLNSIKLEEKGVYVQASTLGSLEALLEFLRTSKVPKNY
ncbi:UNVERIFIED_CONTAM: hypothetical protein FKN15_065573 [Acipenser sinensis]